MYECVYVCVLFEIWKYYLEFMTFSFFPTFISFFFNLSLIKKCLLSLSSTPLLHTKLSPPLTVGGYCEGEEGLSVHVPPSFPPPG